MSLRHFFAATVLVTVAAMIGCGSKDSSSSSSSSGSTHSSSCCLNHAFYNCPSDDDAMKCFNSGDPGSCSRDSSKDNECMN